MKGRQEHQLWLFCSFAFKKGIVICFLWRRIYFFHVLVKIQVLKLLESLVEIKMCMCIESIFR